MLTEAISNGAGTIELYLTVTEQIAITTVPFATRRMSYRLVRPGRIMVEAGRAFGQLQNHGMATFVLDQFVRQSNAHTREAVEAVRAGNAEKAFAAIDAGGGTIVEQPDAQTRLAVIARDFARLSPEDRDRTLVLDPTREGRQQLTDAIRAALIRDRQLGDDALVATVLEPCGLTRAEAGQATSYAPGQIVTFRKGGRGKPRPGIGYHVDQVDADRGSVRLIGPKDKAIDWQPARWGADQAEAFVEREEEFRSGDRVQFTRNNYRAKRLNGQVATVMAVDPQGASLWLATEDGERQMLDLRHLADRHIRPGWVRTIHSAQGATAERVIAHLEAFRANIVDAGAAYVAISRARSHAAIYTDSRSALTDALGIRDGAQIGAIDGHDAGIALG